MTTRNGKETRELVCYNTENPEDNRIFVEYIAEKSLLIFEFVVKRIK